VIEGSFPYVWQTTVSFDWSYVIVRMYLPIIICTYLFWKYVFNLFGSSLIFIRELIRNKNGVYAICFNMYQPTYSGDKHKLSFWMYSRYGGKYRPSKKAWILTPIDSFIMILSSGSKLQFDNLAKSQQNDTPQISYRKTIIRTGAVISFVWTEEVAGLRKVRRKKQFVGLKGHVNVPFHDSFRITIERGK